MDDRQFRQSLRIDVTVLDVWVEQGWLVPDSTASGRAFREADLARGRLILDLVETMGLNEAGVDVVMELVDQVHGLRGTLRDLVDGIRAQSDEVQQRLLAEIEQPKQEDRRQSR